jgi:capsular polysaccharide biosynthesis protein
MELKEYIKIIKKRSKLILVVATITGSFAFLFSTIQPVKYETSLSLFINKNETQETDDFKYDGYYALQASEIIADSIEQWLKSPEFVNAVYQKAQVDQDFRNIKSYTKKFTAKNVGAVCGSEIQIK